MRTAISSPGNDFRLCVFCAVGSSQNVSLVNTVLNTITANKFGVWRIDSGVEAIAGKKMKQKRMRK